MRSRLITRSVLAPAVFLSMLVLAVGVVAARYVQQLQRSNADLMAREVASMLAAEDLNVCMREFRHQLNLYLRDGQRSHLQAIAPLQAEAESLLGTAARLSRADHERELIEVVDRGVRGFFKEYDRIGQIASAGDFREAAIQLGEERLDRDVLIPIRAYVDFSRQVVEGTSRESQLLANHIRLGLILLGASGAVGGLMAGFGIALSISRSIVQLQVPIRGAAGKLNEVVGPLTLSVDSGLDGVNQMLEQMSAHIATVVERLQQREREVLRTEHLAAVGQLAAGLAHELRNPLMPIKIMVQAASDQGNGAGLHGRDLTVIEQEITRVEQSIQDFLEFARPPEPEKSDFDLRPVIQQTLDLLMARADQQHVRLHAELAEDVIEVMADRGQLRQVLVNLVLNALDALPEGGDIVVSAQTESVAVRADGSPFEPSESENPRDSRRAVLLSRQLSCSGDAQAPPVGDREELQRRGLLAESSDHSSGTPRKQIVLRVLDNGPGIEPRLLPRVFQPFVSSKETGTGLGLSICQRIVEAHGGTIEARNQPAGGVEFICRLPLAESQRPRSAAATSPVGP